MRVDVCICTHRRETIGDTIASLARQRLPSGTSMRVIVADNDDTPSGQARVSAAAAAAGLDVRYLHAPAHNISVARNACLAAASAPLVAFIDDDEVASDDWLGALLDRFDSGGAAIVLGPVVPRYAADTPAWVVAADLHATAPVVRDGDIATGYSCNVLIDRRILDGACFDLALGRSGGEDDLFFSRLRRAGHRIAYAPAAIVYEAVPPARARLAWLMRRRYRSGQTYAAVRMEGGAGRIALIAAAGGKALACAGLAAATVWSPHRWRAAAVRGALHAGVIARTLGQGELELY